MKNDLSELSRELQERYQQIQTLLGIVNQKINTHGHESLTQENLAELAGKTCVCCGNFFRIVYAAINQKVSQEVGIVLLGELGETFKMNYQGQWSFQRPVITGALDDNSTAGIYP